MKPCKNCGMLYVECGECGEDRTEEIETLDRLCQNAGELFRGASEENKLLKNYLATLELRLAELMSWKARASEWIEKINAVLDCEKIRRDREDTIRAERNERRNDGDET